VVAEEYGGRTIRLDELARRVEGTILKNTADGAPYGVIVLAEGLGESIDPADLADLPDLPRDEHGHLRLAEFPLGRLVRERVAKSLDEHGIKATMVIKEVGYEVRCVSPNAFDQEYTRELGAGAVDTLLAGDRNVMITRQNQGIVALPFDQILDPATGKTRVRMLDVKSPSFVTAMTLQTRLGAEDLADDETVNRLAEVSELDVAELRSRFS
jgi:6-phosphofructokinase 1